MKRKNASLLGNVLMGLGLVVMVVGVGYSILNQLPQFNMPQYFAHGAGRLTLPRLTLDRNPWSSGERAFHPLYRYLCQHSHF